MTIEERLNELEDILEVALRNLIRSSIIDGAVLQPPLQRLIKLKSTSNDTKESGKDLPDA